MKPMFTSFYLGVVLCCVCFSAHATSSHQLMRPMSSDASFEQEMIESMSKMDQDMAAAPMTGDPKPRFFRNDDSASSGRYRYGEDFPVARSGCRTATTGAGNHRNATARDSSDATPTGRIAKPRSNCTARQKTRRQRFDSRF